MHALQDAPASNPVTKKHSLGIILNRAEIVRQLREMNATAAGRLTANEREAVLAAIYKLEMLP